LLLLLFFTQISDAGVFDTPSEKMLVGTRLEMASFTAITFEPSGEDAELDDSDKKNFSWLPPLPDVDSFKQFAAASRVLDQRSKATDSVLPENTKYKSDFCQRLLRPV
jgi:hypothetical protein